MLSPYGLKTAIRHAVAEGKVAKRRIITFFVKQTQVFRLVGQTGVLGFVWYINFSINCFILLLCVICSIGRGCGRLHCGGFGLESALVVLGGTADVRSSNTRKMSHFAVLLTLQLLIVPQKTVSHVFRLHSLTDKMSSGNF